MTLVKDSSEFNRGKCLLYATSDQHFDHSNVIKYCDRPFSSVEEMKESIVKNFNEVVDNECHTVFLGDTSLSANSTRDVLPRLNGTKTLIVGNHDRCFEAVAKPHKLTQQHWIEKYLSWGFDYVHLWCDMEITPPTYKEAITIRMSHFPYKDSGDHTYEERFTKYRLEDEGQVLLHGHVHEKWRTKRTSKGTLMINVGVDVWNFRPVSLYQILDLIDQENNK